MKDHKLALDFICQWSDLNPWNKVNWRTFSIVSVYVERSALSGKAFELNFVLFGLGFNMSVYRPLGNAVWEKLRKEQEERSEQDKKYLEAAQSYVSQLEGVEIYPESDVSRTGNNVYVQAWVKLPDMEHPR